MNNVNFITYIPKTLTLILENFQPASLCRIAVFHYDCYWGLKGAMQYRNLDRSGQFK